MSLRTNIALLLAFTAGLAAGLAGGPLKRSFMTAAFQARYGALVFDCDSAMRSHLHAKFALDAAPGEKAVDNLKAAEISLLSCQDYDLFQKKLLRWGLREEDLSIMRLKAVEARGRDLQLVVGEHEFRY